MYQGKSGSEFWGAVAGGVVGGAISGAAAAATAGLSLSTGAGVASNALAGFASNAAQSATDQAISEGTVNGRDVVVSGTRGAIVGVGLGSVGRNIKTKASVRYSSLSNKVTVQKEVTKEFKIKGKPLGKSGKAQRNREVNERIKHQYEVVSGLIDCGESVSESVTNTVIEIGLDKIEEEIDENR